MDAKNFVRQPYTPKYSFYLLGTEDLLRNFPLTYLI